jgi:hypothetical protein
MAPARRIPDRADRGDRQDEAPGDSTRQSYDEPDSSSGSNDLALGASREQFRGRTARLPAQAPNSRHPTNPASENANQQSTGGCKIDDATFSVLQTVAGCGGRASNVTPAMTLQRSERDDRDASSIKSRFTCVGRKPSADRPVSLSAFKVEHKSIA